MDQSVNDTPDILQKILRRKAEEIAERSRHVGPDVLLQQAVAGRPGLKAVFARNFP